MSIVEFDENGYKQMQKKIVAVQNAYSGLWGTINRNRQDINDFLKYDKSGLLSAFIANVENEMRRIQELKAVTDQYYTLWKNNHSSGMTMVDNLEGVSYTVPLFSTIEVDFSNAGYEKSQSYQYVKSGKSFDNYNDWKWFRETELYEWQSALFTETSELLNWKTYEQFLMGNGSYSDEFVENALKSILDAMPGDSTEIITVEDSVKDVLGLPNLDLWLSVFTKALKTAAEAGMTRKKFFASKDFEELVKQICPENRSFVMTIIKSLVTEEGWTQLMKDMKGTGELISNATDAVEWIDAIAETIQHYMGDFSKQLSYLDTIEQALINSGVNAGVTVSKIQEVREAYTDHCKKALEEIGGGVVSELISNVKKKVFMKVPVIGDVVAVWGTVSTLPKFFGNDIIEADKTLMGLIQMDGTLTKSYNTYLDMINQGIATEQDVREADKLFELLRSTKMKEYECMMTLAEESGYMPTFKAKYEELKSWGTA